MKVGSGAFGLDSSVLAALQLAEKLEFVDRIREVSTAARLAKLAETYRLPDEYGRIQKQMDGVLALARALSEHMPYPHGSAGRYAEIAEQQAKLAATAEEPYKKHLASISMVAKAGMEPLTAFAREMASQHEYLKRALGGFTLAELQALNSTLQYAYEDAHGVDAEGLTLPGDEGSEDEQRQHLINRLISGFLNIWLNSRTELSQIGIVALIGIASALHQFFQPPDFTSEDRQTLEAVAEQMTAITERLADTEARPQENISHLPRGLVVAPKARLREGPSRYAAILLTLPEGTEVAIAGREGNWLNVIYRSGLTHELESAWVYRSAVREVYQPQP